MTSPQSPRPLEGESQREVVERVDRDWGRGGKAPEYLHPVREACRAGLAAALSHPAPVQQAGHCERQMGCVCGGDTQAVRERCGNWVKGGA